MGFWFTFFLWAATFVLSDYFRARLPRVDPDGVGDFKVPTATQGRPVPQVAGGTIRVEGPNTLWYGDWDAEPVTVETGIVFKRDETVGYKYRIGAALGQFKGRCAGMTGIYIGDDKVFDYVDDAGGVPQTVVDINLPELFGGERSGGGFVGRFRCFTGEPDQPVSSYLQNIIPLQSAWPGMTYVVLTNSDEPISGPLGVPVGTTAAETKGAIIGEANQLRPIRIEFQTFDTIANGGLGNELGLTADRHIIGRDANPIAAAYKILTDPDWSIATSNINVAQFQTVANQIFDEGLGYSRLVDSEVEAFEILAEIEKHIDGYIGPNPTTGFIEIKLARDDYTPASEFQAGPDNILAITDYAKPDWPQTKNDVKVRFVNRELNYTDDHAQTQDMANRIITGRPSSIVLRFEGVRDATVANLIVNRTALAYFFPLAKFKVELDRSAELLRPGDVMIVNDDDIGAVDLPVRITRISTGDPVKQSIKADVVEDVFRVESGLQAVPPGSEFVPPSPDPVTPDTFAATLAPGWLLTLNGETLAPRLMHFIARNAPNSSAALRWRRRATFGSGGYSIELDESVPVFALAGTLRAPLGYLTDTANDGLGGAGSGAAFDVDGSLPDAIGGYNPKDLIEGIFVISPGTATEEFVAVTDVNPDGAGIQCTEVIRAIGDSTMQPHEAGAPVWFVDSGPYVQENQGIVDGGGYQYKLGGEAYGTTEDLTAIAYEAEIEVDDIINRPPPIALVQNGDQQGGSGFYPPGPWASNYPQAVNAPTSAALRLDVWKRTPQVNPVWQADSRTDAGTPYASNTVLVAEVPNVTIRVYDLDQTPNPVRGDEILTNVSAGGDDRINEVAIPVSEFQAILPNGADLNARFEITIDYTNASGNIPAGVESRSQWFDRVITIPPESQSFGAIEQTVLLLHFEGETGTTQIIDYSPENHTVTNDQGGEIDADTPTDTDMPPGVLVLEGAEYVEIPDSDVFNLEPGEGYCIQFRVRFGLFPNSYIPIITKGNEAGDQRQFRVYFETNSIGFSVSTDGINWITRSEVTAFSSGIWYQYTLDISNVGGRGYFFLNGAFDDDMNTTFGAMFNGSSPIRIGADENGNTLPFEVAFDEIRITKKSLYRAPFILPPDIYPGRERTKKLHFNFENPEPAATDFPSDDLNRWSTQCNATTAVSSAQAKFGTQSLECNGVQGSTSDTTLNDGAILTDSFGAALRQLDFGATNRQFCFEGFVRFKALPSAATGGQGVILMSKYRLNTGDGAGAVNDGDWYIGVTASGELLWVTLPNGNTSEFNSLTATGMTAPSIDTWYHFAVVRDGDALALLWEGDRVAYDANWFVTNPEPVLNRSGVTIMLGKYQNGSGPARVLNGFLDELRIQDGEREYDISVATYTVPVAPFPVDPEPEPAPPQPPGVSNWTPLALG